MTNEHDNRWRDDVAAYALGALEGEEARALEGHMESCERCRSELRWLTPAVQLLPESAERMQPPPRLRESVMAEVRADAREQAAAAPRHGSWLERIHVGSLGWRPIAGLAAMALAVVAIAGYEIGSSDSGGGSQPVTIKSQQDSGVFVEMTREGDVGTLELANVQQLPDDRVLEAWVEREGEIEAVPALFVPDHEGRASTRIADMNGVETVMVTREPEGGSEAPTSDPIVNLPISG
ncbi:MAG TPA: anti-sigma factor [Solirubrobacterales bacterium]|jgi:anti-sigma-K factor RskA|nr:anti-sigma factor [Solirubrobacterales bacterium]